MLAVLYFTYLSTIFTISSADETSSGLFVNSSKCNISEDYNSLQSCANVSNELIELFIEYDKVKIPEDVLKNMTEMCQNVKACFSASDCQTSHDYKQFYEAKCQNLEFQKTDLHDCLLTVYSKMYDGFYNCIENYNFLSEDVALRQESFNSGKFCFIQTVINKCSSESAEYINTNYEKVVEMLTVKPTGETCAEPFHEFHSQRCLAAINSVKTKINDIFGNENPIIFDERYSQIADSCKKAQECIVNCCQYDDHDRDTINNLCNTIQISSNKLGECLRNLHSDKRDFTKYSCLNGTELFGPILQNPCELFGTMENCTRTVLEDQCGPNIISENENSLTSWLALNACK